MKSTLKSSVTARVRPTRKLVQANALVSVKSRRRCGRAGSPVQQHTELEDGHTDDLRDRSIDEPALMPMPMPMSMFLAMRMFVSVAIALAVFMHVGKLMSKTLNINLQPWSLHLLAHLLRNS